MCGYGLIGPDGSSGVLGLSTYVTDMDSLNVGDQFTLKNRILSNENLILLNTDKIPGYPSRQYEDGDLFFDKNSLVSVIDHTNANRYRSTCVSFSSSNFFTSGITSPGIGAQRYYNVPGVGDIKLLDCVYSSQPPLDYAHTVTQIYGLGSEDYNSIQYTGSSLTANNVNPFGVWVGNVDPASTSDTHAIALVRETANNTWHFGNLDNLTANTQRANALNLDFNTLNFHGTTLLAPNANVGIGTASPNSAFKLEVVGFGQVLRNTSTTDYTTVRLYNDQNNVNRALEIDYAGSSYTSHLLADGPVGESGAIATTGSYPLTLGTNNLARLTVSADGNVGIGTSVPGTYKLNVNGNTNITGDVYATGTVSAGFSITTAGSMSATYSMIANTIQANNVMHTPAILVDYMQMPHPNTNPTPQWTISGGGITYPLTYQKADGGYVMTLDQGGDTTIYGTSYLLGNVFVDEMGASEVVTTNSNGFLASQAPGSAWNSNFGVTAGTVAIISTERDLQGDQPMCTDSLGHITTLDNASFRSLIDVPSKEEISTYREATSVDITFTSASFTIWDISSIVPLNTKWILLSICGISTGGEDFFDIQFRRNSSAPAYFNPFRFASIAHGVGEPSCTTMLVPVNSDRTLEYRVTSGATGNIIGIVCGWFF